MPIIPEKGTIFQPTPGRISHGIAINLRFSDLRRIEGRPDV
jgi:hypothetical protein